MFMFSEEKQIFVLEKHNLDRLCFTIDIWSLHLSMIMTQILSSIIGGTSISNYSWMFYTFVGILAGQGMTFLSAFVSLWHTITTNHNVFLNYGFNCIIFSGITSFVQDFC